MADVTLPPNVRQVLEFVVDDCRRAIAWEDPSQVEKAAAKKALIVTTIEPGATVPALTAEGEVVPGVTVTARPPSFTVSTEVEAS